MTEKRPQDTVMRETLRAAYFAKEQLAVGDRWQSAAMRKIRGLGPAAQTAGYLELFEQFVWRLTPGVCLLLLVLTTIWVNIEFVPEFDVIQALLEDADTAAFQSLFYLS